MRCLLDTNVVIAAIKGVEPVRSRLEGLRAADVVLSPIVLGELEFGAAKSRFPEANRARLQALVDGFGLVPIDAATSVAYGRIRQALESAGQPIGSNDLWIAAQGIALGATVVTDKVREFGRVAGLVVENWLKP